MVEKLDDMETKPTSRSKRISPLTSVSQSRLLMESWIRFLRLLLPLRREAASLAESVEFESEDEYREKLETLKESYFSSKPSSPQKQSSKLSQREWTTRLELRHTHNLWLT